METLLVDKLRPVTPPRKLPRSSKSTSSVPSRKPATPQCASDLQAGFRDGESTPAPKRMPRRSVAASLHAVSTPLAPQAKKRPCARSNSDPQVQECPSMPTGMVRPQVGISTPMPNATQEAVAGANRTSPDPLASPRTGLIEQLLRRVRQAAHDANVNSPGESARKVVAPPTWRKSCAKPGTPSMTLAGGASCDSVQVKVTLPSQVKRSSGSSKGVRNLADGEKVLRHLSWLVKCGFKEHNIKKDRSGGIALSAVAASMRGKPEWATMGCEGLSEIINTCDKEGRFIIVGDWLRKLPRGMRAKRAEQNIKTAAGGEHIGQQDGASSEAYFEEKHPWRPVVEAGWWRTAPDEAQVEEEKDPCAPMQEADWSRAATDEAQLDEEEQCRWEEAEKGWRAATDEAHCEKGYQWERDYGDEEECHRTDDDEAYLEEKDEWVQEEEDMQNADEVRTPNADVVLNTVSTPSTIGREMNAGVGKEHGGKPGRDSDPNRPIQDKLQLRLAGTVMMAPKPKASAKAPPISVSEPSSASPLRVKVRLKSEACDEHVIASGSDPVSFVSPTSDKVETNLVGAIVANTSDENAAVTSVERASSSADEMPPPSLSIATAKPKSPSPAQSWLSQAVARANALASPALLSVAPAPAFRERNAKAAPGSTIATLLNNYCNDSCTQTQTQRDQDKDSVETGDAAVISDSVKDSPHVFRDAHVQRSEPHMQAPNSFLSATPCEGDEGGESSDHSLLHATSSVDKMASSHVKEEPEVIKATTAKVQEWDPATGEMRTTAIDLDELRAEILQEEDIKNQAPFQDVNSQHSHNAAHAELALSVPRCEAFTPVGLDPGEPVTDENNREAKHEYDTQSRICSEVRLNDFRETVALIKKDQSPQRIIDAHAVPTTCFKRDSPRRSRSRCSSRRRHGRGSQSKNRSRSRSRSRRPSGSRRHSRSSSRRRSRTPRRRSRSRSRSHSRRHSRARSRSRASRSRGRRRSSSSRSRKKKCRSSKGLKSHDRRRKKSRSSCSSSSRSRSESSSKSRQRRETREHGKDACKKPKHKPAKPQKTPERRCQTKPELSRVTSAPLVHAAPEGRQIAAAPQVRQEMGLTSPSVQDSPCGPSGTTSGVDGAAEVPPPPPPLPIGTEPQAPPPPPPLATSATSQVSSPPPLPVNATPQASPPPPQPPNNVKLIPVPEKSQEKEKINERESRRQIEVASRDSVQTKSLHAQMKVSWDEAKYVLIEYVKDVPRRKWPIVPGRRHVIGRYGAGADIGVHDMSLSRKHCALEMQSGTSLPTVLVTDLGSTNGTFFNELKLGTGHARTPDGKARPAALQPGQRHTLRFGHCASLFRLLDVAAADAKRAAAVRSSSDTGRST